MINPGSCATQHTLKRTWVTRAEFYHEPPHSLFLDSFILLLLLPLRVGMVRGHRLREFLDFSRDGSVILFEILSVLKDAVEVFLWGHMRKTRLAVPQESL